jgi:hypothetical protein
VTRMLVRNLVGDHVEQRADGGPDEPGTGNGPCSRSTCRVKDNHQLDTDGTRPLMIARRQSDLRDRPFRNVSGTDAA